MRRLPYPLQEAMRDMSDPDNWAMALLLAACLVGMAVVQPIEDHSAEWKASTDLKAAQKQATEAEKQAQSELRRDFAAAALCREQHGESSFVWTEAGMLVCIPRRGGKVAL